MSNAIRESISQAFGFEPICINSALVSAQNRQRLYWVGKRNGDGTYSKVEIEQPEDRGILLKDILEGGVESVRIPEYGEGDKARPINAYYPNNCGGFEHRMFSENPNKQQVDMIAEPIRVGSLTDANGELRTSQSGRVYNIEGKSVAINAGGGGLGAKTGLYAVPVSAQTIEKNIPDIVEKYGELPKMFNAYNKSKITDKAPTLSTGSMATSSCAVNILADIPAYAEPCEWDEEGKPIKAISYADGKIYQVYEVKDGLITIKDKQYPIKLPDGFYIIRKLIVRECMRLQTIPEWYEFSVSDTQAYKMLGNGWTVEVIIWLLQHTKY
jgi:DNA (cytosine-5)-methyltransferase 3A